MTITVFDLMAECRNGFVAETRQGSFTVSAEGVLAPDDIPADAAVVLREQNGALHCWQADSRGRLPAEAAGEYRGDLAVCVPPPAFRDLAREIDAWVQAHPPTDLQSERLGEYSYARFPSPQGMLPGWPFVFAHRLDPWRGLLPGVMRPC